MSGKNLLPRQILDLFAMNNGIPAHLKAPVEYVRDAENGQENQFRTALLNGFGQFFIVILVLAGYQVYVLLESFLQPLAWAVLTGTILFPFKTALAGWGKQWISGLMETETPLAVGIIQVPFKLADKALEHVGGTVVYVFKTNTVAVLYIGIFLTAAKVSQLIVYVTRIDVIALIFATADISLRISTSNWVWLVIAAYVGPLVYLWKPEFNHQIRSAATPVFAVLSVHIVAKFGLLAVPAVLFGGFVLGIGFIGQLKLLVAHEETNPEFVQSKIDEWGSFAILSPWNFSWWPSFVAAKNRIVSGAVDLERRKSEVKHKEESDGESEEAPEVSEADQYLKILFKCFVVVQLWQNIHVVPFLIIPTIYSYVKKQVPHTDLYRAAVNSVSECVVWLRNAIGIQIGPVVPQPMMGIYRTALSGDRKILSVLNHSLDEAAANIMIFLMFLVLIFSGFFVVYQVQQETSYVVRMSGEFMNNTIRDHPEFLDWLPEGTQVQDRLQNSVDSLYVYSREFVGDAIRGAMEGTNGSNADQITNEVLVVMDRIYYSLVAMTKSSTNTTEIAAATDTAVAGQLLPEGSEALLNRATNMFSWTFLMDYGYAHFETLYSIGNSAFVIIKENGALIASMATSILSFVLTYFSQFLDFILNAVFFLAALSFLLSLSGDRYYPLEKISHITTYFPEAGNVAGVIEQAISGIFNASFKMATFYGVYTYTLLSIFGLYVRFIPSVVAGIFAVIPLFPAFIVCVPALLELLFIRQEYFMAALLAVGAYAPSTFVDDVMYQEVKTAHPYMFGLSVAGGLMTMGIQGVVVGPIVLCAFVIVIELSRMILKPPEQPAMAISMASTRRGSSAPAEHRI